MSGAVKVSLVLALVVAACGDNTRPLTYRDPPSGGQLRLIETASTPTSVTLAFVVGDAPVTGFSTGFDLPLDASKVTLASFTPGSALDPGTAPVAARAVIASTGPLAGTLLAGQSQKATDHPADTRLAPGAVLFTLELSLAKDAPHGVVFDGTAKDFVLPSGGLRDRTGTAVVPATGVAIGRLDVNFP